MKRIVKRLVMVVGIVGVVLSILISSVTTFADTPQGQESKVQKASEKVSKSVKKPLPTQKININTATERELKQLPNIGDAMAKRIIEYRNSIKGFKSLEELKNVKGIGEKIYEKIRPYITL